MSKKQPAAPSPKTKDAKSVLNETQIEMIAEVKEAVKRRIYNDPHSAPNHTHALILGMESAINELQSLNAELLAALQATMKWAHGSGTVGFPSDAIKSAISRATGKEGE